MLQINTPLTAEEIDFRVQSVGKRGQATLLPYKDARADMNRLDAIYGIEGWQKKYDLINGNLFCSIGIWSKLSKQWIWKQDVGTESYTEKEKGQASDAFKRAATNIGIGRELYEYPTIKVQLDPVEFDASKGKPTWNFKLNQWQWISEFDGCKLVGLAAKDQNGKLRFKYGTFTPKNSKQ